MTAGTIGARVTDGSETYGLSNNHVFANRNEAKVGDNVIQPGIADGGSDPEHAFGTLTDFEKIRFCSGFLCPDNRLDAGHRSCFTRRAGRGHAPEWLRGASVRNRQSDAKPRRAEVRTDYRTHERHRHWAQRHHQRQLSDRHRAVRRQIIISGPGSFSTGGDSGSLIVTRARGSNDRKPVALLFAGSANTTIANPIDLVLERFGVSIDGG